VTGTLALVLASAPTRRALLDELRRLRSLTPAALAAAIATPASVTGGERVAITGPLHDLSARLDLAISRLPAVTRPRFVSRPHGLVFTSGADPGRLAVLFPGQGAQYVGMLRGLYDRAPVIRSWFDTLDTAAEDAGMAPLTSILYPPEGTAADAAREALHGMERGAQLGTVAALALYDLMRQFSIRPDGLVGHSNGEHPAIVAAGRVNIDRQSLCRSFVALGRRSSGIPPRAEQLVAVAAPASAVQALLEEQPGALYLAMDNCPTQLVIGGLAEEVEQVAPRLAHAGAITVTLPFTRAFHTPLFSDWAERFATYYRSLPIRREGLPVYSCLTGAPLPDDPDACRASMVAQWTRTVRFRATIERMYDEGFRTFVEVGPDRILASFVEDILRGRPHTAVSMLRAGYDDITQLHHLVAELFVAGVNADATGLLRLGSPPPSASDCQAAVHVRLRRHGRDALARTLDRVRKHRSPAAAGWCGALLGAVVPDGSAIHVRRNFTRETDRYVEDHALGRPGAAHPDGGYPLPVLPFTLSLALAAEAAAPLVGDTDLELTAARATRWLALDAGSLTLDVRAAHLGEHAIVRMQEAAPQAPGPAFEARVGRRRSRIDAWPAAAGTRPRTWTVDTFYTRYAFHGPAFRVLCDVSLVGDGVIEADLRTRELPGLGSGVRLVDPAMLDAAGQLVAFWLLEHQLLPPTFGIFPFALDRLYLPARPVSVGTTVTAHVRMHRSDGFVRADARFEDAAHQTLAVLEGLHLRLVRFPDTLARRLFHGDRDAVPGLEALDVLSESWGIWARALAHLALPAHRQAEWRTRDPHGDTRVRWLLSTLANES
jgi:acyl transferase domain-containing protein